MKRLLLATAIAMASILPAKAANMYISDAGYFAISGDIERGDFQKFKAATAAFQEGATIFFASPGGMVSPAIEIGQEIRARKFTTAVWKGQMCASACAIMWLAGTKRFIHPNGAVGFHAAYDSRTGLESGMMNAVVGAYMRDLGYSFDAIMFATKAGPNAATWVHADAVKAGIRWETMQ